MGKSNPNLTSIFTDTANAIRRKTGSEEIIYPVDFADEIDNIPSPSGSITFTQNGEYNVGQYMTAVVDIESGYRPQLYPPQSTSFDSRYGTISVQEKNTNNGTFAHHYKFYINNELYYEGALRTTPGNFYETLSRPGDYVFSASYADKYFIESDKIDNETFNIPRGAGYMLYKERELTVTNNICKFLTTYTEEPNEYGDTAVIDAYE